MKRFISILFVAAFAAFSALTAFAEPLNPPAAPGTTVSHTEYLENDITVVTTITYQASNARSICGNSISKDYYHAGKYIAHVYLEANFTYNGRTSSATSASGNGYTASGWSYSGQSTWCSGATAYLTATITNGKTVVPVSLSLTCDANGNLS